MLVEIYILFGHLYALVCAIYVLATFTTNVCYDTTNSAATEKPNKRALLLAIHPKIYIANINK